MISQNQLGPQLWKMFISSRISKQKLLAYDVEIQKTLMEYVFTSVMLTVMCRSLPSLRKRACGAVLIRNCELYNNGSVSDLEVKWNKESQKLREEANLKVTRFTI